MADILLGLLTKTLHDSPVVHRALSSTTRGILYLNERSVRIHDVEEGHLRYVATIDDFDCRILSAITFPVVSEGEITYGNDLIKVEDEKSRNFGRLRFLAITLASAELVLFSLSGLTATDTPTPIARFPLPANLDPLQCFGKFLAAEPHGRAITVAAPEAGILLVDVSKDEDMGDPGTDHVNMTQQRPLIPILGTILHMEFLYPPANDPDHIILLVIKVVERKILIQHIEWLYGGGTVSAKVHSASRIHTGGQFPTLLIPLQSSAAFLLACGTSLYLLTDLLSGHVQQSRVSIDSAENLSWTAYARPTSLNHDQNRQRDDDLVWLSTEQGSIFQFEITNTESGRKIECLPIASLEHPVSSIFNVVNSTDDEGMLLLAGGETTSGGIYHAVTAADGEWDFTKIDIIQNWTPTLDLISSDLPRGHEKTTRSSDGLFVTSSSHNAGNVAELRSGLEARSGFSFSLDELRGCQSVWAVSNPQVDGLLLVLSYPAMSGPVATRVLSIDEEGVSLVELSEALNTTDEQSSSKFDPGSPTISIGTHTDTGTIVQITDRALIAYHQAQVTSYHPELLQEEGVLAADLDLSNADQFCAALVIGDISKPERLDLVAWHGSMLGEDCARATAEVTDSPTALGIARVGVNLFAVAFATQDSRLCVYLFDTDSDTITACDCVLGSASDVCDSIAILRRDPGHDPIYRGRSTTDSGGADCFGVEILCGLRSGSLQMLTYTWSEKSEQGPRTLGSSSSHDKGLYVVKVVLIRSAPLGSTSVKITATPETSGTAIAVCESSLFTVSCSASDLESSLKATPIWITDLGEPGYQQGPISAVAQTPYTTALASLGLATSLITISEDECRISEVSSGISKLVPRTLSIKGAPNRLTYSRQLSHFIVASMETIQGISNDAPAVANKQIRGLLIFQSPASVINIDDTDSSFLFHLQSNEKVYALTEWVYRSPENKKYGFVLVATGIHDANSSKGRIHILQPGLKRGRIDNMTLANTTKFDAPVYALSLFGDLAYVTCAGNWLVYAQYSVPEKKWVQRCRHRLSSPAVHITTSPPFIHITTAADSLTTFSIEETANDTPSIFLRPHSTDTRPAPGLHHVTISSPSSLLPLAQEPYTLNILSSKTAQLRGLLLPSSTSTTRVPSPCLFQAQLPRSLTRLAVQNISPTPTTSPVHRIVGTSIDGSVTQLRLLSLHDWAGVRFLVALLQRSSRICPYSYQSTLRAATRGREVYGATMLPLGLRGLDLYEEESEGSFEGRTGLTVEDVASLGGGNDTLDPGDAMDVDGLGNRYAGPRFRAEDMHVDGDVLQRLLDRGGESLLREILKEEAESGIGDRVAVFIEENLERELRSVRDVILHVRRLLGQDA